MAKRFTDNEKWKKAFFKGLSTVHKLFFLYLLDDCNHAGVWEVELDVAALRIGEPLDGGEILEKFNGYITVLDEGRKWFIPAFIQFQYGTLNPSVNAHKSVLAILHEKNLTKTYQQFIKGSSTLMDMDKDKDKDKDKDRSKKKSTANQPASHWEAVAKLLPEPMRTPTMEAAWLDWEADRRERRKPITKAAATRQAALLAGLGNVATAKATIDKAISHGWTGLYADESQTRATTPPQNKPRVVHPPRDAADLIARFNRREIKTINGVGYDIGEFRLTKSGDGIQIDGVEIWNAEQLKRAVYA